MTETRLEAAFEHWGRKHQEHLAGRRPGWLDNEWVVRQRVFPMLFGTAAPDASWEQAPQWLGVPTGGAWLDLGCGAGDVELGMAKAGIFETMRAIDGSAGSIAIARQRAASEGADNVTFEVADVNTIELPPEAYDVVHITMALHHVEALEHVLHQIARTLRPGGVFLTNEYVGPSQFQFSDERIALVQQWLATVPPRLRWDPNAGAVKHTYPRFPPAYWDTYDPTEAVRSAEIPALLARFFPKLVRHDYGGNLASLALENILPNFDFSSAADAAYVEALFRMEDELLVAEPSDFAFFVCPRGSRRTRLAGRVTAARAARRPPRMLSRYVADDIGVAELRSPANVAAAAPVEPTRGVGRPLRALARAGLRRGVRWYVDPPLRQQTAMNHAILDVVTRLRGVVAARENALQNELDRQRTELTLLRAEVAQLRGSAGKPVSESARAGALAAVLDPFHRPVAVGDDVRAAVDRLDRDGRGPATAVAGVEDLANVDTRPDGIFFSAAAVPSGGADLGPLLVAATALVDRGGQVLIEVAAGPGGLSPDPEALLAAAEAAGLEHRRLEPLLGSDALLMRARRPSQ